VLYAGMLRPGAVFRVCRNPVLRVDGFRRGRRNTVATVQGLPVVERVALHFMCYNFSRVHRTLRLTPAMEARFRIMFGRSKKSWPSSSQDAKRHEGPFGSCCKSMHDALTHPPNSLFRIDEDMGVLYLSVGYVETQDGPGWFDQAVVFCPFCGSLLQTAEQVQRAADRSH